MPDKVSEKTPEELTADVEEAFALAIEKLDMEQDGIIPRGMTISWYKEWRERKCRIR